MPEEVSPLIKEAFKADGMIHQSSQGEVSFVVKSAGDLLLITGKIVAQDALVGFSADRFSQMVPAADYPVVLSIACLSRRPWWQLWK